jgi:hypothetical protein
MRPVCLAVVVSVLAPAMARAEPIPLSVASAESGFGMHDAAMGSSISLGTVLMPSVASVGHILVSGLRTNTDVVVSFMLESFGKFDTLRLELFNPPSTDNREDAGVNPADLPAGFSSSNNYDALSFAQDSGLERSAIFAGGSAGVFADEYTHPIIKGSRT